ncbi:MAG: U32 family peptidase [Selenomonadaceae bacterium]|nr:U32 family peptidase [Selenomonadaceae bacterium]
MLLTINKPELLAPAGNLEKLKIALIYGADAVYVGGKKFGLRAFGGNFSDEELKLAVDFAHSMKRKVYVTVNIFAHNEDVAELPEYLRYLDQIGVDAVLISDLGVFSLAKELTHLELHVSTQANVTNYKTVEMWRKLGASRVVLARELSQSEIVDIKSHCDVELEMFVHGAMCISYSGRCYLSHYLTGRDGNQGQCTHSCRWKYSLVEEKRPGEYFEVNEDERGAYVMNSKDLCLLPYLDKVIESGVSSLKIEGRMKSVHYVAGVVKVYREAIDSYFNGDFKVRDEWIAELDKVAHRPYTTGFFVHDENGTEIHDTSKAKQSSNFLGVVKDFDPVDNIAIVEQRGKLEVGQQIEILQPQSQTFFQTLTSMFDEEGNPIEAAPHAQQIVKIKLSQPAQPWSLIRTAK